jgi:hypothetical protein
MDPTALVTGTAVVSVDLHPSTAASPAPAVAAALARRLLTWCPDLGGVLLAAGPPDLAPCGGVGRVRPLSGYVRVAASVRVTLLRPRPGRRLPAVVARTGSDYVALHVLGAINGAVGADRLAAAFAPPRAAGGPWVSRSDPDHALAEGTPVLFRVTRVRSDGGYCSLVGAMDDAGTGEASRALAAVPVGADAPIRPPSAGGRKRGKEGRGGGGKEGRARKKDKKEKRSKG